MSNPFFDHPILNAPDGCPTQHWELDESGQPTQKTVDTRRRVRFHQIKADFAKKVEAEFDKMIGRVAK